MELCVTLEHRFVRTPDGKTWTQTAFPRSFWQRYLSTFDKVRVIARASPVDSVEGEWKRVDGAGVSFHGLPDYQGPFEYALLLPVLRRSMANCLNNRHAILMRVPSTIASLAVSLAIEPSRPFSLEVVGDPHEAFSPGAVVHPLRGFFRWWFRRQLRSQCVSACGVAYVTRESLQRRYPFQSTAFSTYYSDIELDDSAFVKCPRQTSFSVARHRIVAVGSLEQLYKGPDVLVEAARICIAEGIDLEIIWLGDGKFRPKLLDSVHSLGLSERISFTGQVPGGASVRRYLDKADLFILPSRTEGLPRALIEAMARGLPCLGSDVGGIPELLHAEDLVKPGDADDLARQIKEVLSSQERRSRMSTRNLLQASQYHENLLRPRRDEFYAHVRDCTHIWNRGSYPK